MATEHTHPPNAEVLGNVCNYIPQPSGAGKRGNLMFDASFESGNLGKVDYISDYEYDLFIRPDTCNPRYRVWFNFKVQNVKAEQRVIFNVVNFSKTKSLYRDGMSPVVKSTSRPQWQRISSKNVFYYKCPEHQKNYVLSFAFAFDIETDVYEDKRKLDFYKRELLCYSVQKRRLDLLTITSPHNLKPTATPKVVFITARVHPGETPASYVCQGFLEFILSDNPIAQVLRDNIIFKVVPMLNPDGVYLGNYRCCLMGFDLNRHWQDPSPWAHPTLFATKQLLLELDRDVRLDLGFYIDIHAHSTLTNGFMYGNIYEEEERFERQAIFPKLLAKQAEDFSWDQTSFNKDAVKAGTGRRSLGGCLHPKTHCYTLEVSFFSYTTGPLQTHAPYNEESYLKLGENVACTFSEFYNLQPHHRTQRTLTE